jgi:hypothetical protein
MTILDTILDKLRSAYRDGEPLSLTIAEMGELLDLIDSYDEAIEQDRKAVRKLMDDLMVRSL